MPVVERCFRPILRRVRRRAIDYFVTPSDWLNAEVQQAGYSPVETVPNFVQDTVPQYEGEFVLFVGRLSEAKGPDTLIKALSHLQNPPPVKIAGKGPFDRELEELIESLNLTDSVDLLGYVSEKRLEELYQDAKFVVVPSRWRETFGLVAVEAMAAGCPVIGSDQGALPEIISHGNNGRLFPAEDERALSQEITTLQDSDTVQMGQVARDTFEERYRIASHVDRLEEIYFTISESD
jgi:glycosyltransferase involved in cell wall biosynthesis